MSTRTVVMTSEQIEALKQRLAFAQERKTPPYALYQLKTADCVITAYTSGKVVFQGEGADLYVETPIRQMMSATFPQAGSDEVGTGDYFGPVTVCAAYVAAADVTWLQEASIQDSKALSDEHIRKLGPLLMERLPHSLLILDNETYNRVHATNNMVAIKAKLHNQAYVHLQRKLNTLPSLCVVDQFVQKTSYYRYLRQEKQVISDLHFETKAENKYLAVACASVIARYGFLKAFDDMERRYDFSFLKGAGSKVDENIRRFVERFGKEELRFVAKLHFANTTKAGVCL